MHRGLVLEEFKSVKNVSSSGQTVRVCWLAGALDGFNFTEWENLRYGLGRVICIELVNYLQICEYVMGPLHHSYSGPAWVGSSISRPGQLASMGRNTSIDVCLEGG